MTFFSFTGVKQVKFKILPHSITSDDIQVSNIGNVPYSLGGAKPEPVVTYAGTVLTKGTDYTLNWKNNGSITTETTKKLPTVVIKGKGNFKYTRTVEFNVIKQEISEDNGFTIQVKDKKWSKTKNSYRSVPVVRDSNGKKLKAGRDYEKLSLDYYFFEGKAEDLLPQVGTIITVNIVGKGKYYGTITGTYTIISK